MKRLGLKKTRSLRMISHLDPWWYGVVCVKYAFPSFPDSWRYVMRPNAVPYPLVASDPVLHTVNKFNPSLTPDSFTSHSPPSLAISLFLPTSSSATFLPSSISSCAISRGDLFWEDVRDAFNKPVSRRVAAPRLTAVGRAVNRYSRSGITCGIGVSNRHVRRNARAPNFVP